MAKEESETMSSEKKSTSTNAGAVAHMRERYRVQREANRSSEEGSANAGRSDNTITSREDSQRSSQHGSFSTGLDSRETVVERKLRLAEKGRRFCGANGSRDEEDTSPVAVRKPGAVAMFRTSMEIHVDDVIDDEKRKYSFDSDDIERNDVPTTAVATTEEEIGGAVETATTGNQTSIRAQVVDERKLEEEIENRVRNNLVDATGVEIDEEVKHRNAKLKKVIILATLLLTLVIVAIAVSLSLTRSDGVVIETDAPTAAPTALVQSDEEQELLDILKRISPDNGTALESGRETPQFKALLSLVHDFPDYKLEVIQYRYVLAVLYYSTDGDNWVNNDNWVTNRPLCEWYIRDCEGCNGCDSARDAMLHLKLDSNGLRGTLPDEFGILPPGIQYIDLSDNELEGEINEGVFDSVAIQSLELQSNPALGGTIENMANLIGVQTFDVSKTNVTGSLRLNSNLAELKTLNIAETRITGTLPSAIGNLTRLSHFDAGSVHFEGTIPTELGLCTDLEYLQMNGHLHGTIPTELYQLTKLTELEMHRGLFQGTMSSYIGQLTALAHLHLNGNYFVGSIPTEIGSLTSLERLRLAFNEFTGQLPTELGQLSLLSQVYIRNNKLTGTLPTELGNCTSMENFRIGYNQFEGAIPSSISSWTGLQFMYFEDNNFSGQPPYDSFKELKSLTRMFAHFNNFTGNLPDDDFWAFPRLIVLRLGNNAFSGTIPTSIGLSTRLTSLALDGNALTGPIPAEIGSLEKLDTLSLYGNNLASTLPTELGRLTVMDSFYIHDNRLIGEIPREVGNLLAMETAYFDGNQFSGTMPFCGAPTVSLMKALSVDCDEVLCDCCTHCCNSNNTVGCFDMLTGEQSLVKRFLPRPGPSPAGPLPPDIPTIACNATDCYGLSSPLSTVPSGN